MVALGVMSPVPRLLRCVERSPFPLPSMCLTHNPTLALRPFAQDVRGRSRAIGTWCMVPRTVNDLNMSQFRLRRPGEPPSAHPFHHARLVDRLWWKIPRTESAPRLGSVCSSRTCVYPLVFIGFLLTVSYSGQHRTCVQAQRRIPRK